jgi:phosphatidylinositol alpha-1,6-mannosyltransferase
MTIAHCGRALPEGIGALLARLCCGGPRFLCWTHGEELDYAKSSRELTALQARVHRRASALLANSRNTALKLEALGVPVRKVRIVYPGVDVERFAGQSGAGSLRRRLAPKGEPLLLTVGRLQRRKGQDLVIKALAFLKNDFPSMRYVIVGTGEERGRLEQLADNLAVRHRIDFVGAATADELPAYYAAADMFVHPNRVDEGEAEGFGIVFLEAAAAGLPTIGGNSGGVPEAVESGTTGILVEGHDVAELADAIRRLATDEALRRRMGGAGRALVRRAFTWERAAADVAAVHRELEASA